MRPVGMYIEKRTNLVVIENKNPEYKDRVLILSSPLEDTCSISRYRATIDFVLNRIEFFDLEDTTLYMAGLQTVDRFNILNFKEILDKFIERYNNIHKDGGQ